MLMLCAVMTAWGETTFEDFITFDFTSNSWNLPTSSTTQSKTFSNGTYTISISAPIGYYYYSHSKTLLMGKTGAALTLPVFGKAVSIIEVVGIPSASDKVTQNIYVNDTPVSTRTIGATGTNTYVINRDYQAAGNEYSLRVTNSNNTQIKYIRVYFSATISLNTSGFATYASTHPLDFSNASDYTAWQITGVSGNVINFQQITGAVAEGTGVFLKGTAGESVEVPFATTGDDISGTNKLEGITTATEIVSGKYYGLSGSSFVKVNAGNVPAGKALLPARVVDAAQVKALMFVFDHIDGVRSIETVSAEAAAEVFNLAGQRISSRQPGINIVNGKKVLVK